MKVMKKITKAQKRDKARLLYYNKGLSNEEIARILGCSPRTIMRWKNSWKDEDPLVSQKTKRKKKRKKKYPEELFARILELKQEAIFRSASGIHRILREEFSAGCPSVSTVRKYIAAQGFSKEKSTRRDGYIKFQRKYPNDLWQIDIAGVQTVGHLGMLYLIALLDDHSRFIVAAKYFTTQNGINVLSVVRDGIMAYGRPNQIIADNGRQFRNVTKDSGSKYIALLMSIDVQPIYSRPYHPQSKGKLERWFGTVKQMFLTEARIKVKKNPEMTLGQFNLMLNHWVEWYNFQKSHRSLPLKKPPAESYLNSPQRIFRPLEYIVDWNRWINTGYSRKVTKQNMVSFKGEAIQLPKGYAGCRVDLLDLGEMIEIYHQDILLCTYELEPLAINPNNRKIHRKIAQNGTIQYLKKYYSIDYKLARKKVEIKESCDQTELLIYLNSILIKRLSKK